MNRYQFDEKKHVHTLDGKRLHGVTTVLSMWGNPGGLINWAANCAVDAIEAGESPEEARKAHTKKRDKAGDIGTQVHKELEDAVNEWIKDGDFSEDHSPVVLDVLNWLKDNDYVPYKTEAHLYSELLWVGGIVDLVVVKDKKTYIMDFKTSNTVQTKHLYQMGAYSKMWTHMTGDPVEGLCVLHIPKGKKFNADKNVYMRYDVKELEDAFSSILQVYKLDKDVSKLLSY